VEVALASANTKKMFHAVDILCIDYHEACQRKNRANRWNNCHPWIECPDSKTGIKNLFGFRARNFQHPSLASGRVLFSHCGADPSREKNGLSSPIFWRGSFLNLWVFFFFWEKGKMAVCN
jgi:hypothetical protein